MRALDNNHNPNETNEKIFNSFDTSEFPAALVIIRSTFHVRTHARTPRSRSALGAPQSGKTNTTILKGMADIYTQEGWRAFWNGNGANVLKIMPESAMRFLGYELFKEAICHVRKHTMNESKGRKIELPPNFPRNFPLYECFTHI